MKNLILTLVLAAATTTTNFSAQAFTLGHPSNQDMLGWNKTRLSLYINSTSCGISIDAAIQDAIALWNSAPTSGLQLVVGGTAQTNSATVARNGTSGQDGIIVLCDTAFGTTFSPADPNSIPGVGGFVLGGDNHIATGYLILNSQAAATANIANLSAVTLATVIAHEIGHAIGLGHSDDTAALMYYSAGRTTLRLGQDDIDGVTYLYPRKEIGGNGVMGCGTLEKINPGPPGPGIFAFFAYLLLLYGIAKSSKKWPNLGLRPDRP